MSIIIFYGKLKYMRLALIIFILFLGFAPVSYAKVLPRFATKSNSNAKAVKASTSISVSPKLRSDRKALTVYFSNLQAARQVTYTLMYQTNGKEEGVSGSISGSVGNTSRELLFGTCSSGVCRYHTGITNMRLEILTELTSGKKTLKKYKIKL